jgi:hypothetical protein
LADPRQTPDDATLIAAADALHNLRGTLADVQADGLAALDKFNGGWDGTAWRYLQLAEVLGQRRGACRLTAELRRLAAELAALVAAG